MRNIRTGFIVAVLLAATAVASAGNDEIHITTNQVANVDWKNTDSAGYLWDIYTSGGYVKSGTNNAYHSSMILYVNGSQLSGPSASRPRKDGNEIEIGPWKNGAFNVYRRIYIDKKLSYVRWIEIFENTSDSPQKLEVKLRYNLENPTQQIHTTLGKQQITPKDWGMVTQNNSGNPCVIHIFAAKNTHLRPTLQINLGTNLHWCLTSVNVPAKKTVALCFFEAQRNSVAEAKKFMENFKPTRELGKVSPALKQIILNMGTSTLIFDSMGLPRGEKTDLIILRNNNELAGTIINDKFLLETSFGKLELPARQIIGFQSTPSSKEFVQAALVDGQIISGKLTSGLIKIKLSDGNVIPVSPDKFATVTFAISEKRPSEIPPIKDPTIILRGGQQLFFDTAGMDYVFQTEHGELKLSPDHLRAIHLTGHDGSMHIAEFANGTMLSGLLTEDKLNLKLKLGLTMEISRQSIAKFVFPKAAAREQMPWNILLHNSNEILGTLVTESLVINSAATTVTIKAGDIKTVTFEPESLHTVSVKLFNGTTITGELQTDKITVQLQPSLKMDIAAVHIADMTHTPPPPKPTPPPTPPTTKPETPTTKPATTLTNEEKAKLEEDLKKEKARLAEIDAVLVKANAEHAALAKTDQTDKIHEFMARLKLIIKQKEECQQKIKELKRLLAK